MLDALKSFGRANLTVVYANGWLCLNSLHLDAMDLTAPAARTAVPRKRRGVQLELPGTRHSGCDLFGARAAAPQPSPPRQGQLDLGGPDRRC